MGPGPCQSPTISTLRTTGCLTPGRQECCGATEVRSENSPSQSGHPQHCRQVTPPPPPPAASHHLPGLPSPSLPPSHLTALHHNCKSTVLTTFFFIFSTNIGSMLIDRGQVHDTNHHVHFSDQICGKCFLSCIIRVGFLKIL